MSVYFTIKRINKGLKLARLRFRLNTHFTIKRINKGLKQVRGFHFMKTHFTIKRINKGLKLCIIILRISAILP